MYPVLASMIAAYYLAAVQFEPVVLGMVGTSARQRIYPAFVVATSPAAWHAQTEPVQGHQLSAKCFTQAAGHDCLLQDVKGKHSKNCKKMISFFGSFADAGEDVCV